MDGVDGDLVELTRDTCVALLRGRSWGRIAAGVSGWPAILPVNYVLHRDDIVFRSGAGAKLEDVPYSTVAFQIDDAHERGRWGWSVLVQGAAFDITHSADERSRHLRTLDVPTWAPGPKDHWIRVAIVNLTGRAFGAVPELDLEVQVATLES